MYKDKLLTGRAAKTFYVIVASRLQRKIRDKGARKNAMFIYNDST